MLHLRATTRNVTTLKETIAATAVASRDRPQFMVKNGMDQGIQQWC